MAKQIVIFMDGTWNDPTERTNVYKLFGLVPGRETSVPEKGALRQHIRKEADGVLGLYIEGVGAKGTHQGVAGGALGAGMHNRVIDAFLLTSRAYEPGDKLWIFGFSRGAWSARSLAALIGTAGLLAQADREDAVIRAEGLWFEFKAGKAAPHGDAFWKADPHPITLVGVWDTVGALGIPFFNGLGVVDHLEARLFEFADMNLGTRVGHGRQALSIDETRFDFTPTLWNDRDGIVQTWFSGAHADVGGGYPTHGLADLAFAWMVGEVNGLDAGLRLALPPESADFRPEPLQNRHDEARKAAWKLRPRKPRRIPENGQLAPSVLARLAGRSDYRPAALKDLPACRAWFPPGQALPTETLEAQRDAPDTRHLAAGENDDSLVYAQKWWNMSGLEVKAGERYRIRANGEWTDRTTRTTADGYASNSLILTLAEKTRRVENANWFALVAAIHADPSLELKNPTSANMMMGEVESFWKGMGKVDAASQLLAVGTEGVVQVERDGYLYFFANDSGFAYSNNGGCLMVTVTREN